jgi:hypothetical protein
MSLQQFLIVNRLELIERTRKKVACRASPHPSEAEMEHGVPLFLSQLATALEDEQERNPEQKAVSGPIPKNASIARSATLHGQSLRQFGFTIEQVVHDYGDVCQAVTELADELNTPFTTTEFHTLNWCLDNAIAKAVTSWNDERDKSADDGRQRHDMALLNLVSTAAISFDALQSGRVGSSGATAAIVQRSLSEMRSLLSMRMGRS